MIKQPRKEVIKAVSRGRVECRRLVSLSVVLNPLLDGLEDNLGARMFIRD